MALSTDPIIPRYAHLRGCAIEYQNAFQRCQAEFFIAEWFLLKDERAATTLQDAAQNCPRSSAEYADAQAELKRLRERATSH